MLLTGFEEHCCAIQRISAHHGASASQFTHPVWFSFVTCFNSELISPTLSQLSLIAISLYISQFTPHQCRDQLRDRAREFWLVLDDVSITDLSFGAEFTAAIEAKQVAQQNAQRAALTVDKAKQEKMQKIVEAQGNARSIELVGMVTPMILN